MGVSHLYQDFGRSKPKQAYANPVESELKQEEEKLESFEDGYKSGWDDAISAQKDTNSAVSSEFAQNLQDASFSFHEARASLAKELREVVEPLLDALLPKIAKEALASHVMEQVASLSSDTLNRPIEIAVSPARMVTLQSLCEDTLTEPFVVIPDETLGEDQVFLRVGKQEREVELETWLQEVKTLVSTFFDKAEKDPQHV